ncbi:hypothetical protein OVA03_07715 [Asticcacaulis sp. SL142]|uniref:hypothetical protein n=1 Tax=Asticcacaulis sp. SL142 TaxID=2995155 RepID=UPI00226D0467|nr:hypothetical protein [Asticcacaulis sp. SL142]WAC49776.1 hypothetical protein OVA03_07715 [Asticcacaulis sp. SL142]
MTAVRFDEIKQGFAICTERFRSYRAHFEELEIDGAAQDQPSGVVLNSEFLKTQIAPNMVRQLEATWSRVVASRCDISGNSLPVSSACELKIVDNLYKFVAEISPSPNGGSAQISVSTGLLLQIDIMASVLGVSLTGGGQSVRWSRTQFSKDLENFLGVPYYLSYFCRFVSTSTEDQEDVWAKNVEYSLEWIVRHELGHLICGHLGYFSTLAANIISEQVPLQRFTEEEINYGSSVPLVSYTAELLADSYATLSMALDIFGGYRLDEDDLGRGQRCNVIMHSLAPILFATIVPIMLFQLPEIIDWRNRGQHVSSTHPRVLARFVGVSVILSFLVEPPSDIRFDPVEWKLRRAIVDVYEEPQWYFLVNRTLFGGISTGINALSGNGLLGGEEKEEFRRGWKALLRETFGYLKAGRFAYFPETGPDEQANTSLLTIRSAYREWSAIMQAAGRRLCGFFVGHLDSTVINSKGLVVDPAYFILDDLLGKAQQTATGTSEFFGHSTELEFTNGQKMADLIIAYDQKIADAK